MKGYGNRAKDLTGLRVGRLVAVSPTAHRSSGNIMWLCQCYCGETKLVGGRHLLRKSISSCGCLETENRRIWFGFGARPWMYKLNRKSPRKYYLARRARTIPGLISSLEIVNRMERLGGRCVYCGGPYEHVDHLNPLSRGGKHEIDNLYPSCANCNLKKQAKLPGLEWFPSIERIMEFGKEW